MFPNAVTTWKSMETPKKVCMTTFDRAQAIRRPPPTSKVPWILLWFQLLTRGLVPGPIPFNYIINLVAFPLQPPLPGTSYSISHLADITFSFTPYACDLSQQSADFKSDVWGFELPLSLRPVLVLGPGWCLGRGNHVLPQKHFRVSCPVSSGKLEDALVSISPGRRAYKESDAHSYTTLFT